MQNTVYLVRQLTSQSIVSKAILKLVNMLYSSFLALLGALDDLSKQRDVRNCSISVNFSVTENSSLHQSWISCPQIFSRAFRKALTFKSRSNFSALKTNVRLSSFAAANLFLQQTRNSTWMRSYDDYVLYGKINLLMGSLKLLGKKLSRPLRGRFEEFG